MSTPPHDLDLPLDQLRCVRDELANAIRDGLAQPEQTVRALPAHLPPPPAELEGEALVVDTGGTNSRAAVVRLKPGLPAEVVAGPVQKRLPVRLQEGPQLDADGFFDLQAQLAHEVAPGAQLPVGYCFSYPSKVGEDRDARLLQWTKGITIPGVEGEWVGAGLVRGLKRAGLKPTAVCVLNDTVASLLGGTQGFAGRPRDVIGLIAGTGTNMAGFYDASQAARLSAFRTPMAINLESGNFHPPGLVPADDVVDAESENPGRQRFEKAVSGYYLPFVFAALHPEAGLDPHAGTAPLAQLRDHGPDSPARATAGALLARSADLIAAGVAGVIETYPASSRRIGLLAEGSLFWRAPGYADRVKATLRDLVASDLHVELLPRNEANLVGAACAALTP